MIFNVGDVATLTYALTVADVLTDATVALTVTAPDGTSTTPTPTHPGLGTYTADILITQPGTWTYRWAATGAATDTETGRFIAGTTPALLTTVTPSDVADLLAQRVLSQDGSNASTFDTTTVPTAAQVQRLIDKVTSEETGGLGTIPDTLQPMLSSLITLAAAVRVLGAYFSGDNARDDLDTDLASLRERFREAVETVATTGDPNAVSAEGSGAGDTERPPAPAWSFPETFQELPPAYGYRVTTLGEQH